MDIIELLYEANNLLITDKNRLSKQETAKVKFKLLDYICDLSAREKCILFSQYENIAKYINNCMKLLNGWIKSDKERIIN